MTGNRREPAVGWNYALSVTVKASSSVALFRSLVPTTTLHFPGVVPGGIASEQVISVAFDMTLEAGIFVGPLTIATSLTRSRLAPVILSGLTVVP